MPLFLNEGKVKEFMCCINSPNVKEKSIPFRWGKKKRLPRDFTKIGTVLGKEMKFRTCKEFTGLREFCRELGSSSKVQSTSAVHELGFTGGPAVPHPRPVPVLSPAGQDQVLFLDFYTGLR